jgi:P27 family predicted phage terminase small subunit
MAKPGPKPAPPEARKGKKRIEGTARRLDDAPPECPAHLDERARAKWAEVVALLDALGTLSRSDRDLIALYCESHSRYVLACEQLTKPGDHWYETDKGALMNHPWFNIRSNLAKDLIRIAAELGLTPSARSRVASNTKEKAANPLDQLIMEGLRK